MVYSAGNSSFAAVADPLSNIVAAHSALAAAIGGIAATYIFFWSYLRLTQDANEPPLVSTSIPFLSPIFGMVRWSMGFYTHMRDTHPDLPIYTLRLPGVRLYIVNSTALIPVVQRQWRTLLFPPVSAWASEVAMGCSKEATDIMRRDMVVDGGFMPGFIKVVHPALAAGPALDELNGEAIKVIGNSLDAVAAKGPTKVKMFEWIRRELLMATTDAVYGPHNPLKDPQNETAWHKFNPTIMFLMLNLLPLWVFKQAIEARELLAKSFRRYHAQEKYSEGSAYIQRWTQHFIDHNIAEEDISKFHVAGLFALVANTIPTAFWMVYRVFSDPTTLQDCRDEVSKAVEEQGDSRTIDISYIKNSCPILVSTFQEVFRVHGMANSVRVADSDQLLDDKYLIKKGGMIMMPGRVQHHLREVWGGQVDDFDHTRFLRKPGVKRHNPVAFRGFGGGTTLCPGRHFATTEILLFVTMLLLRFDIEPVGGHWVLPTTVSSSQAEAMEQPDRDPEIELRPRPGADKKWRVLFSGGADAVLVAEDH